MASLNREGHPVNHVRSRTFGTVWHRGGMAVPSGVYRGVSAADRVAEQNRSEMASCASSGCGHVSQAPSVAASGRGTISAGVLVMTTNLTEPVLPARSGVLPARHRQRGRCST
jgi:hypothetical protein